MLAVGLWFLPTTVLWAATTVTLPADATILQTITIAETTPLNFGTIERPTGGPFIQFTMAANGTLNSPANGAFVSGQNPGLFTLNGNPSSTYSISSTPGSCTGTTFVVLSQIILEKATGTFTGGSDTVAVGFTLDVAGSSTSTLGSTCTYTLNVDY